MASLAKLWVDFTKKNSCLCKGGQHNQLSNILATSSNTFVVKKDKK